jgi:hypothetical protein
MTDRRMEDETPRISSSRLEDTQPDAYGQSGISEAPRVASPLRNEQPQIRRKNRSKRNPEGPISGASGE